MFQPDSLNAFEQQIQIVFLENPGLEWLVIPVACYVPALPKGPGGYPEEFEDPFYESRQFIQSPITILRGRSWDFSSKLNLMTRPTQKHEVAVGTTWLGGFKDTSVRSIDSGVFDGRPGLELDKLSEWAKAQLTHFKILSTGNSYHFFCKDTAYRDVSKETLQYLMDPDWKRISNRLGGYLRVTANIKGEIKKGCL